MNYFYNISNTENIKQNLYLETEILRGYFRVIGIIGGSDQLAGRLKDERRIAGGIMVPRKVKAK